MTTNEAIWTLQYVDRNDPRFLEAVCLAITALHVQDEAERNDPLTPDDLRDMGGEPYWHVGLQPDSPAPHWTILPEHVAKYPIDYFYGENWLAYRQKLKAKEQKL